ncbi:protein NRT1/ PTR FAMILY 5.4 [Andrographis paniculata]|uniref:protein NRT1/ PTR FAMILY 5.4 n=1 Tax=Andrographis paniculata TaxID=175694 RepID=UPI0021E82EAE|nr:protein NRT1/ PTR FAMILY 5.4 [Andrographis paniculata]
MAMEPPSNSSRGGWKSAIFIIAVEVAERFAYYGVSANLMMYLTKVFHQPMATAARNVNNWIGVSAVFPVLGGFLADSYVGRFRMILASTSIYLLGLISLTIAVSVVPLQFRHTVFFTSLYILAVGEGGHRPCVQTFAADQFDDSNAEEKAAKSSFFNWWFVGIVFGATMAVLVVVYIEDHIGWSVGYAILSAAVAAALIVFLVGSGSYRREVPVGSPFTRLAQVAVAAARKQRLSAKEARGVCNEEEDSNLYGGRILTSTARFRFLDKAAMIDGEDALREVRNPWRLCSINQIEETKLVLQLIPIWLTCLMFAVVLAQVNTYFTKQISTLRLHLTATFQVPPASFQVFPGLTILISIVLYERLLVPSFRRLTGHPSGITILQRIGTGLVLSILTMSVAALLESNRLRVARQHGLLDQPTAVLPMAAWWLIPQYVMMGFCDVFTVIGLQELFYDQMPPGMRSLGAAAYLTVTGVGNFMSSILITIVKWISSKAGQPWLGDNLNRAKLENFYWLLAAMSAANFCGYLFVTNKFLYKRIEGEKKEMGLLEDPIYN